MRKMRGVGSLVGEGRSDAGGLASFSEALQLLTPAALTRLLVIGFAPHLLAKSAALAQFAEAADGFLDRLAGTNP